MALVAQPCRIPLPERSIPMPDVIDLILADHRRFEALLHQLRDATADRAQARADLSALLVAHAEAEEAETEGSESDKAGERDEVGETEAPKSETPAG